MRFDFFFFNDTATTEIYTLSLHDALPICIGKLRSPICSTYWTPYSWTRTATMVSCDGPDFPMSGHRDRKSPRLNSSHANISYAVFCLKKTKNTQFHY